MEECVNGSSQSNQDNSGTEKVVSSEIKPCLPAKVIRTIPEQKKW
jgi:hypothetical protein